MLGLWLGIVVVNWSGSIVFGQHDEVLRDVVNRTLNRGCLISHHINLFHESEKLWSCINNEIKPLYSATTDNQRDHIITEKCREPYILLCIMRAKESVEVCMSKEQQSLFIHLVKSIAAAMTYTCKNEGEALKKLARHQGSECFKHVEGRIINCLRNDYNWTMHHGVEDVYTAEGCKKQDQFGKCFVSALTHCEDKYTSEFVEGLIKIMLKETPCVEYLNLNGASALTLTSLVSTFASLILLILLT